MNDVDAWSLTYVAADDTLYAAVAEYDGNGHQLTGLNRMNSRGGLLGNVSFSRPILAEQHAAAFQAVAVDDERLVILAAPPVRRPEAGPNHCYVINLHSGLVEFACEQSAP